jgi:hypothetical protein
VTEKTEKQLAEDRKAAALRANLKRRKAAARKAEAEEKTSERGAGPADQGSISKN